MRLAEQIQVEEYGIDLEASRERTHNNKHHSPKKSLRMAL